MLEVAEREHVGRALNLFTAALLGIYLVFILGMMLLGRATVTPDVYAIFALAVAAILGRTRLFLTDWLPFVAILLAWQAMRGLAWQVGFPIQSDSVIQVERLLAFGAIPSEILQSAFHTPGQISLLDVSMAVVYMMHFFGTLTVAFVLWLLHRPTYHRFAASLLVLSIAQFVTAVMLPVAPPRFAYLFGESLAVADIGQEVGTWAGLHTVTWAYAHMNANPVAAFPSLHAAYPILAALIIAERWPRIAWAVLGYGAVVWFAIMYLGHHYLIDAIGGAVYAVAAYWVVRKALGTTWRIPTLRQLPASLPVAISQSIRPRRRR